MNLGKYDQIRDQIRSGDVILFSGKNRTSSFIKNFTHSKFSHIGMCIWLTPKLTEEPRLFIFESTTLNNIKDSVLNEYRVGVQMIALGQRLEGYEGLAVLYPLRNPLTDEEKVVLVDWAWKREVQRIGYDTVGAIKAGVDPDKWIKPLRWIRHILPWFTTKEDLKKYFCSELVTNGFEVVGRIPVDSDASEVLPEEVVTRFDIFGSPIQL